MLYDHIEPDVWFDLTDDMRVRTCRNALDWCLYLREWLEEAHDTLANSYLLALLMYVRGARVEEMNLAVCEVFFARLARAFRQQSRIDDEH